MSGTLGMRASGAQLPWPMRVWPQQHALCLGPPDVCGCSDEEMAEELGEIKDMWEMAATLDYLTLFK